MEWRGVFMEAVIIDQDSPGDELRLSVADGKPWLMSINVKEMVNGLGTVSLTLQFDRYREAVDFLDSRFLKIGNTASVRWGYVGKESLVAPWHHGFLRKPEVSFGEEFQVTLQAECFGWGATRYQDRVVWNGVGKDSGKWTRRKVIYHLAEKYGLNVLIVDDEQSAKALDDPKALIMQGGMNDWAFIRLLAMEAGCYAWTTNGTELNIVAEAVMGKEPDPVAVFRFFGQVDFDKSIFPAMSFESDTTALFLPQRGRFGWIHGPNSKEAKRRDEDESTSDEPTVSGKEVVSGDSGRKVTVKLADKKVALKKRFEPDKGGSRHWPILDRGVEATKKGGKVVAQVGQWRFDVTNAETAGVSAQVHSIDVPWLTPGDLVRVEGVGKFFSVPYRVWEINRSIGSGGAEMDLTLQPRGLPRDVFVRMIKATTASRSVQKVSGAPTQNAGVVTKESKGQ
ncbi:MAG: hypothetical protein B1H11_11050 [Desulfobacteraceae bacterium 4484_190.1]|nr:MAG: hypothetical protein B1H11_11050 [Desulfobacteraceae bacterium 4484_190.1]